jgi:hypothetical protein
VRDEVSRKRRTKPSRGSFPSAALHCGAIFFIAASVSSRAALLFTLGVGTTFNAVNNTNGCCSPLRAISCVHFYRNISGTTNKCDDANFAGLARGYPNVSRVVTDP